MYWLIDIITGKRILIIIVAKNVQFLLVRAVSTHCMFVRLMI